MAAVNSVQNGLHLPLTGIAPPRVLMCSASMGAEGSVTLQLREAVQAPDTPNSLDHTALTISGYPDPEILADVLGSLQAAALNNNNSSNTTVIGNTNNAITASCTTATTTTNLNGLNSNNNHNNSIGNSSGNNNCNNGNAIILNGIKTGTTTSVQHQHHTITTSNSNGIPNNYNSNNSNNTNSNNNGANSNLINNSNNINSNQNCNSNNNNNNINVSNHIVNCNSSNSNSSTSSNNSNSSSNISSIINSENSNTSIPGTVVATVQQSQQTTATMINTASGTNNNNNSSGNATTLTSNQNSQTTTTGTTTTTIVVRKQRPKTSSPTRHGPQQCQVCSKIFGNASALAKHKLTHSDERKYVCAMCSKAFKRQDHLNGHMLTHRNKKPYECKAEGCGKSYCDARSLRRHTENHHSALAMTPTTPNQSLSPSTGPPTGLSLSPATASGDASSPHGANCVQYITNNNSDGGSGGNSNNNGANNSKPSSPSSPASAGNGNDGLTRQQLDLISQIMQQTKQASAQVTVSTSHNGIKNQHQQQQQQQQHQQQHQQQQQQQQQNHQQQQQQSQQQQTSQRPRTWNMQTQLQQQSKLSSTQTNDNHINGITTATITNGGITINTTSGTTTASQGNQTTQHNQSTSTTPVGHTLNIVKIEQKPVECNLCHRKFKNIPALNGHMRLHGGYFKKETETKKCEKKETSGPPLQTASIGVRALIEEKIISKRCKDLKGAFVVPAPPLATTIRRANEIENSFLTPKNPSLTISPSNNNTTATISLNTPTSLTPTSANQVTTTTAAANQNVQIHATTLQLQKQTLQKITSISTISQGTSTESKDATLIELLKRGTKVAVKRTCSDPGQIFNTTNGTQTILLPASSLTTTSNHNNQINSNLSANVTTNTTDLALSTSNTQNATSRSPLSISLPNGETAPLALTISQAPNGSGDVFTLTYSTDSSSTFFSDSDVYSVSDTAMLLQAVDSIQLLNDSPSTDQLNQITSIADLQQLLKKESTSEHLTTDDNSNITLTSNGGGSISCVDDYNTVSNSKEIQDVLNSPLPDNIAEFSTFHSKDFVLYNCSNNSNSTSITQNNNSNSSNNTHCSTIGSPNASSSSPLSSQHQHQQSQPPSISPLPSPLAYPTPPASHEAITQSSPFLDDSHHFPDASAFFDDKSSVNFITDSTSQFFKDNSDADLTESEKILSIKNELFNESKSVLEVENGDVGANRVADAGDFETDVFDSHVKVEDLLNEATGDEQCDLKDFSDQNLSFLDEPESFLDDSRNPSSPLSESFFTSGIGSAEEVKEVLKDVLPNESLEETNVSESQCENDIDLYYLPGLTLQSQMMPNSDDPLLSSSPKDFGHHKIFLQQINPQQQIISPQSNQQQHLIVQPIQTQQSQSTNSLQQQLQKFDPIQLFTCATTTANAKNTKLNESLCAFPLNSTATNVVTMIGNNNCQQLHSQQQQLQHHISNYTALTAINNLQNSQSLSTVQQQQQKDNNCIILANTSSLETFLNTPSSAANTSQSTLPTIINITSATGQNFNNFQTQNQQQQQKIFNTPTSTTTLTILPSTSQSNQKLNQTQPQSQQISTQTIAQTSQITSSILKRRLRQGSSSGGNSNIPKKQEVYRSKLRKPSTTHYTPAPILNPDRKGTGLYSNLPKSIMQDTISLGDEFEDTASSLVAFLDDSKVNIGTAYQAQIPPYEPNKNENEINNNNECSIALTSQATNFLHQQQQNNNINYNQQTKTSETSIVKTSLLSSLSKVTDEDYDEIMWDPNINENRNSDCDEKTLNRFIELTKSSGAPLGFHTEEVALKALLDANGFTHIAVLTLLQSPSNAVPEKWSANEIEAFLKGLEKYGKDFYRISNDLKTKTTKECIQLYYFWKKLCVDYKITHLKQETCDTSDETASQINSSHSNTEHRPYVCEMPDCSASFTSKAALHSHTRLHCIGRNHHFINNNNNNNNNSSNNNILNNSNSINSTNTHNNSNNNINSISNNTHSNNNSNNNNSNNNDINNNDNNINNNNNNNNSNNNNNINNNNKSISNQSNNHHQIGTKNIIISSNGNHHNNNNNNNFNNNDNNNNVNVFQFGQTNNNHNVTSHQSSTTTIATSSIKDDFPCKVCGNF